VVVQKEDLEVCRRVYFSAFGFWAQDQLEFVQTELGNQSSVTEDSVIFLGIKGKLWPHINDHVSSIDFYQDLC
jgi:hypothetical protein